MGNLLLLGGGGIGSGRRERGEGKEKGWEICCCWGGIGSGRRERGEGKEGWEICGVFFFLCVCGGGGGRALGINFTVWYSQLPYQHTPCTFTQNLLTSYSGRKNNHYFCSLMQFTEIFLQNVFLHWTKSWYS